MEQVICIKDYLVKDFPEDYTIPKGEVLDVIGYLMGHPTLIPDPIKYPSQYKHLDTRCFVVFDDADKYFKKLKGVKTCQ